MTNLTDRQVEKYSKEDAPMKTAVEIFEECSDAVIARFPTASNDDQLKASVALVDLTLRANCEANNQQRWEQSHALEEKTRKLS